jgi:hypothetical protein
MNRLRFALFITSLFASRTTAAPTDFVRDVRPILQKHCYSCHGSKQQKSGLRLDIKSQAFRGGDSYGPSIIAGKALASPVIQFISGGDADLTMPPDGDGLSAVEVTMLTNWVVEGAIWPDGVDLAWLEDRRDHWSFKPVAAADQPAVADASWPRCAIDHFILARLEQEGLQPAPQANRVDWLRRVYFDLIGLPPTPEQVSDFDHDQRDDAYERVVDQLLKSPRYGERWAQHWLDVVRYADTHGFEVNTERPNAWPYRDYVIRAFNSDTPYDQFIREQLTGDLSGQDAATGFLVTAAALLPGQIGKDAASIRRARQDELGEIVINTGRTFLGLSIGCARCHDHKFDAISSRDYYAMQAFFSGVHYGDRPIRSPEADAKRLEIESLKKCVAEIETKLAVYQPLAQVGGGQTPTDPRINEHVFEPLEAKFVRMRIHDANLHPSLGLIEPCIDEFEIYTAEQNPRNVALANGGTKVTASGSRTSASHRLEHVNDGQYGNSHSWMSSEPGRGWLLFELPEPVRIGKIVWSRDRNGQYSDRLATAYTLEVGTSSHAMKRIAFLPPLRSAVSAKRNIDRFQPLTTDRLRFTIHETNRLAPCIDELEIFDVRGTNVALASLGTIASSSGNAPASEKHKLEHVNDGQYGNGRSWMSSEDGRGWVELRFSKLQHIERVEWARDRQGKFSDRLPLKYTIEVLDERQAWRIVATAQDRRQQGADEQKRNRYTTAGLTVDEAAKVERLVTEVKRLESQITAASASQMVFGGQFTKPEATHLLFRGDPEQPQEEVAAAVLTALGNIRLPADAADQERRRGLADWIASPQNPLTSRVMVNRIWQWHFGTGLVETASDFGRTGTKPTHPDLLDWLATEFVRSGWSTKQMHRLLVLSATYRQSSQIDRLAQLKDANVRWLWRFPSRRLESESIRDGMLAVSGRLNLKTGGPGFDLFRSRGGLNGFPPIESFDESGLRRLIYAHKIRMERDIVFGAFDCPDAGQSTPRRRQSTTPIQALNLLNSRFTLEEAEAFAARVQADVGDNVTMQICRAYQLAFGRNPDAVEINDSIAVVEQHGMSTLCRVIFNSNEFLFLP